MRIIPLGGLGEVGRNMTVFEVDGRILLVDCGVLFPEEHQPGVDLILPDFTYLEDKLDRVEALVLTHGHEDHIGAVPYLLRRRDDIEIIGSKLTLALVDAKLKEHRIRPKLTEVKEGQRTKRGPFDLEFVAVNHSIPDALAVFIRTTAANALITGDFKMDQLPLDGRITDLRAFARMGEEGVDIFLVDSTNAEVPGFVTHEVEIGPVLDRVIGETSGKVVVASFASHIHRVQQVFDAAALHRRKVALVGRSMVRNMSIAEELGYLQIPDGVLVDLKDAESLPDHRVVYMCTGSQGEPRAVLSRIAQRDHRVEVGAGDTVIFASSMIPGNENSVFRLINGLTRLGARVVHQGNERVHVSGHAAAGELIYCYNIVQPANVMPIHGEIRHLVANGGLAVKTGIDPKRVMLAEDGVVVDVVDHRARVVGAVECEEIYVDGDSVGEITEDQLKERRVLGEEGFVAIYAVVDRDQRRIMVPPSIQARGLADDSAFDELLPEVGEALASALESGQSTHGMQQAMRRVVGRYAGRKLRRAPMIIPTVVEI